MQLSDVVISDVDSEQRKRLEEFINQKKKLGELRGDDDFEKIDIKDHLREGSTTVGTFGYFPMEQMMGQAQAASDLYALGMTILVVATRVQRLP